MSFAPDEYPEKPLNVNTWDGPSKFQEKFDGLLTEIHDI